MLTVKMTYLVCIPGGAGRGPEDTKQDKTKDEKSKKESSLTW